MKSWHIGIVLAVVIGYVLGVMFPSVGQTIKSKLRGAV